VSRTVPVARVDVFTARPFAGNPAAAVLDADGLAEPEMQAIAGELRAAGTAFVTRPSRAGTEHGLRTFTPTREVAYSGHTTLGAVRAMLDAGRIPGPRVVFATTRDVLSVAIEHRPDGAVLWLEPSVPACAPYPESTDEIRRALGLRDADLAAWAAPSLTGERDLLLAVRDLDTLHALGPDHDRLARVGTERGLRGVCAVSAVTVEPGSAIHSRFFAPHFGIPEDIVTGSVHSALAVWLFEAGRLAGEERASFTAEQGDVLGRPGRLAVEVRAEGGRVAGVRVGGRAVTVLAGRLRLG
jgi:PhzF family phenazine biosynthesis protein